MPELMVVGFEGKHRAAEVLDQVQRLYSDAIIELRDGVAVYRTDDGRLRVDQSLYPVTKAETATGALLGALVGAVLALPVAALAAVPAAAAALGVGGAALGATGGAVIAFDESTSWRDSYGISDEFVKEVGGMVQPGQSAVFVLAQASDPAKVAEQFRGYGGKVLRTTLPADRVKKVQEALSVQSR